MIFLNPLVLFGLFASAIPLIIHLLNLRKLKKIEFSSLAFLKELQQNKIRKLKLKQWLLLLLRTLIIILLVLVFARPTVQNIDLAGVAPAAKSTSVFILDNSYSMTQIEETGSYLNLAKKIIRSIMERSNEGDDFAVITSTSTDFNNPEIRSSKDLVYNNLNSVGFAYESGSYLPALKQAEGLLGASHNLNKNIYLFTDLQKNNFAFSQNDDSLINTDKNNVLFLFNLEAEAPSNLSIKKLNVENQIFEKGKPVSISAEIMNNSPIDFENSIVSLFANGVRVAQKSFNIKAGADKKIDFNTVLNETGYVTLFTELEDDDFQQDNRQYSSIYLPEFINTAIIYKNENDIKFILPALTNEIVGKTVKLTKIKSDENLPFDLTGFDVIMEIGAADLTLTNKLKNYLSTGGNLILMPGENTSADNYSAFLESLNIVSSVSALGSKQETSQPSEFSELDFNHLIFRDMFKSKKDNPGSPEFFYYFKYGIASSSRTIISLLNNISFLSEIEMKNSKILLFNSAPSLQWSNWPVKTIFAPLITKSVFYLSSKTKPQRSYLINSPVPVNISSINSPVIKITRPDASDDFLNIDSTRIGNFINYSGTNLPGAYRISAGDKTLDLFTVNVDTDESSNDFLQTGDFEEYLKNIKFKGKFFEVDDKENFETEIYQARFGTELWKIFLLTALFLALAEMYISRSSKKDLADSGK